jgi:hypothetical protein
MKLDKRPLGRSGLSTAPLALGGNVFGWTADEPTSFAILDRFVDLGFNLIDTAEQLLHLGARALRAESPRRSSASGSSAAEGAMPW